MDRQFVSFPKSGRSWVRYALTRLGVADAILFHHDGFEYNNGAKPPLDFDYAGRLARYDGSKRVVYLQRDPRDVMVSLYHQVTGRFQDFFHYRGSISAFIRDPYFGAENLQKFRAQWSALCAAGRALGISYEACHADLPQVLAAVVAHYGFKFDRAALAAAAEASRFDAMKAVEESGKFREPWLRPRNGALKVRRGRTGGYVDELSPADIAFLNAIFF